MIQPQHHLDRREEVRDTAERVRGAEVLTRDLPRTNGGHAGTGHARRAVPGGPCWDRPRQHRPRRAPSHHGQVGRPGRRSSPSRVRTRAKASVDGCGEPARRPPRPGRPVPDPRPISRSRRTQKDSAGPGPAGRVTALVRCGRRPSALLRGYAARQRSVVPRAPHEETTVRHRRVPYTVRPRPVLPRAPHDETTVRHRRISHAVRRRSALLRGSRAETAADPATCSNRRDDGPPPARLSRDETAVGPATCSTWRGTVVGPPRV